jgi:hypothetical protein
MFVSPSFTRLAHRIPYVRAMVNSDRVNARGHEFLPAAKIAKKVDFARQNGILEVR